VFPIIIILLGYFNKEELKLISGAIKKWRNPLRWKLNLELEKSLNNKTNSP